MGRRPKGIGIKFNHRVTPPISRERRAIDHAFHLKADLFGSTTLSRLVGPCRPRVAISICVRDVVREARLGWPLLEPLRAFGIRPPNV